MRIVKISSTISLSFEIIFAVESFIFHICCSIAIAPEVVFCIIYCLGVFSLRSLVERIRDKADAGLISVGDYSVLVRGVPPTVKDAKVVCIVIFLLRLRYYSLAIIIISGL